MTLPGGIAAERHSARDARAYDLAVEATEASSLDPLAKLEAFPRFVTKRSLARFLVKAELFQKALSVAGSIVECGVYNGAGLFSWAQLSTIYEPVNHTRKVIGFDTFSGFPGVSDADHGAGHVWQPGDLLGDELAALHRSVEKHDAERPLGHVPQVELVAGDFLATGPAYVEANPHLVVSLLYLDFDLYEPTRVALETFLARMPAGALLCFDELNCANFPGETQALLETVGLSRLPLRRFPIDPWITYAELP
jgi:hypothetical protein